MIQCPNCSANNARHKFCDNCGTQLITDEIDLHERTMDAAMETKVASKRTWLNIIQSFIIASVMFILVFFLGIKLLLMGGLYLMTYLTNCIAYKKWHFLALFVFVFIFM